MAFALVDPDTLEPIEDLNKFAKLEAHQTIQVGSSNQKRERQGTHLCTQQDLNDSFKNIDDFVVEHWEGYQCLDHPENIIF